MNDMDDRLQALADDCGKLLLERAKKMVSGRKSLVIAATSMVRHALDELSPDERAAMLKSVITELTRA
jgi:hypothetical protein